VKQTVIKRIHLFGLFLAFLGIILTSALAAATVTVNATLKYGQGNPLSFAFQAGKSGRLADAIVRNDACQRH
jgi:hypothetical protein